MLPEQTLKLSEYSALYDIIVPQDNLLRKIKNLVDFSFVHKELVNKYCQNNGRTANDPICMFKYLLLKVIYNISDKDLVERSRTDMAFKYFLDLTPEEDVINPSSLTKFRKQRLKDVELLDLLIGKTVAIAIEQGVINSRSIIVDATHSYARSIQHTPLQNLKLRTKQLRKIIIETDEKADSYLPEENKDNDLSHEIEYAKKMSEEVKNHPLVCNMPKVSEPLNIMDEDIDDIETRYTVSKDKDARVGHKTEDSSFLGYKTHLAITEERIITAATITAGNVGDGPQLPKLVEKSKKNGINVETVIGDAAYGGDPNLKDAKNNNYEIIAKPNASLNGKRKDCDKFDYNKDADQFICPAGHMSTHSRIHQRKGKPENPRKSYFFDVKKCKICPLREGCYKEGSQNKAYSISVKTQEQIKQQEFVNTPHFKEKYRERYKIEAKNAELKNVHGYDRAISYGLVNMNLQGAMTIFAVNLKRILNLV